MKVSDAMINLIPKVLLNMMVLGAPKGGQMPSTLYITKPAVIDLLLQRRCMF